MSASPFFRFRRMLICFLTVALFPVSLFSQTNTSNSGTIGISPSQSAVQTFVSQQRALAQEWQALVARGATAQQLQAWRQQNAGIIAAQDALAATLSAASYFHPLSTGASPKIPANASPALANYLTARTALADAHAQIHNQLLQSLPAHTGSVSVLQLRQQESQAFQQQHATDVQAQLALAESLGASNHNSSRALAPPRLMIPRTASSQLKAYLTLHYQLIQSRAQLIQQESASTPAARQQALQTWREQNTATIQQLQQLAASLGNTSSATNSN